jgi:ankyrin repeat protein
LGVIILGGLGVLGYQFFVNPVEVRLYDSLIQCDTDAVTSFLAAGRSPNIRVRGDDWESDRGLPAIHVAATCHHMNPLKVLIAAGADVNARDSQGATALFRAGEVSRTDALEILVAAGADVNAQDHGRRTTLFWAAFWGRTETVNALITKRADLDLKDNFGATALMIAKDQGHAEIVRVLEQAGATK